MDISQTIVPKSDQKNSDDFMTGPQTFTIESVTKGSAEQPVNVHLVGEKGKPYKPSKSMLRVLAQAWGLQSDAWVGQSLTLFRNPSIRFGGQTVGGIEISHMTGIPKRLTLSLAESKGKRKNITIEPLTVGKVLPDVAIQAAPQHTAEEWQETATSLAGNAPKLQELWRAAKADGATNETLAYIHAQATTTEAGE